MRRRSASHHRHTGGVRRGISALMIAMNGDIQPEIFRQILVRAITHECGIIANKVQVPVDGRRHGATPVHVSVDASCESGKPRDEREAVLQGVRPIVRLLYSRLVCLLEHAVVVERRDANAELRHRMYRGREPVHARSFGWTWKQMKETPTRR